MCFEMLTGNPPFQAKSNKDLDRKILTEKLVLPSVLSSASHSFLKGLLERDVSKRLGASKSTMFQIGGVTALKEHEFFKGLDWQKVHKRDYAAPIQLDVQQHFVSNTVLSVSSSNSVNSNTSQLESLKVATAQITTHFHADFSQQIVRPSIVEDCIGHLLPTIPESEPSSILNSTTTSASNSFLQKPNNTGLPLDQELWYVDFEYHAQEFFLTTVELYQQYMQHLPSKVRKIQDKRYARTRKEEKKAVAAQSSALKVVPTTPLQKGSFVPTTPTRKGVATTPFATPQARC